MVNNFQIGVIIATAFKRTELLFGRSLRSVLNQTYSPNFIVIVDDNKDENEYEIITEKIVKLDIATIFCIHNFKTKYHSGTGAWNSGIDFLCKKFNDLDNSYIAILDDDDEWDSSYLEKCANQIMTRGVENTKAICADLVRLHKSFKIHSDLCSDNLTIDEFLVGNPGVQGSNTFLHTSKFLEMSGFDETLKSCADRDMMIQFLQKNSIEQVAFIKEILVYHHAQSTNTVSSISALKWAGLDAFYRKYINIFTTDILEKSLKRAEKYFSYPNRKQILNTFDNREKIVLAMPLHNNARTIRRAVLSIINQKNIHRKLMLVIGDDNSTDNWQYEIEDLITENIIIINVADGGKAYKVRNAINNYILKNIENVAYISRLDADDELADNFVISQLEKIIDVQSPDVIFAGNYQRRGDKIVGINVPTYKFLDSSYLLGRLSKMSNGDFGAELPSCNTFVKSDCMIEYPSKDSAEDHWFNIKLLLKSNELNIYIAEGILYAIYSISGDLTKLNHNEGIYIESRKELYSYYKGKING